MAVINRSFEQITTTLYNLEAKGLLAEDYRLQPGTPNKGVAARINCYILSKGTTHDELDDRNHYSRMRADFKKRRINSPLTL